MSDDESRILLAGRVEALRRWHDYRAADYAARAEDRRASRHTKESHGKLAAFHRAAADTLAEVIDKQ